MNSCVNFSCFLIEILKKKEKKIVKSHFTPGRSTWCRKNFIKGCGVAVVVVVVVVISHVNGEESQF